MKRGGGVLAPPPAKRQRPVANPAPPPQNVEWDISIDFDGPYLPNAVVEPYPARVVVLGNQYTDNARSVQWFKRAAEIPQFQGVYVVTNGNIPVYAGEAKWGVGTRYRRKASGIHELGLVTDLLAIQQRVWAGDVLCENVGLMAAIGKVEAWLIRYLLIRDYNLHQQGQQANRQFVNLGKTSPGSAPAVGMTLAFSVPAAMNFLWYPQLQDLNGNNVANLGGTARNFSYTYQPNAPF